MAVAVAVAVGRARGNEKRSRSACTLSCYLQSDRLFTSFGEAKRIGSLYVGDLLRLERRLVHPGAERLAPSLVSLLCDFFSFLVTWRRQPTRRHH